MNEQRRTKADFELAPARPSWSLEGPLSRRPSDAREVEARVLHHFDGRREPEATYHSRPDKAAATFRYGAGVRPFAVSSKTASTKKTPGSFPPGAPLALDRANLVRSCAGRGRARSRCSGPSAGTQPPAWPQQGGGQER